MNSVAMALKVSFECKRHDMAWATAVRTEMLYVGVGLVRVESRPTCKGHFIHLSGYIFHLSVMARVAG